MTKTFKLRGLDCAVCAGDMERTIKKLPGVEDASVSFLTQKLVLKADSERFDEITRSVVKACRRVEPDCVIELA